MSSAPNKSSRSDAQKNPSTARGASVASLLRGDDEVAREATSGSFPVWIVIALGLAFFWGETYLDRHAGGFNREVYGSFESIAQVAEWRPQDTNAMFIAMGKQKFELACQVCHQASGLGTPGQFPPLAGSEWVTGSPARLIRIPDKGLTGPITVNGQPWNAQMVAAGAAFDDTELAALLSYVRQAWGNGASLITPAQVKAVREETANHPGMWTADELLKVQ